MRCSHPSHARAQGGRYKNPFLLRFIESTLPRRSCVLNRQRSNRPPVVNAKWVNGMNTNRSFAALMLNVSVADEAEVYSTRRILQSDLTARNDDNSKIFGKLNHLRCSRRHIGRWNETCCSRWNPYRSHSKGKGYMSGLWGGYDCEMR